VRSEWLLVLLLTAAAIWLGLLVIKIDWWVEFYRYAKSGLARSSMGYRYYQFLAAAVSMVVLGLPAALIGSVLPLLIRALSNQSSALAANVGRLLTWNTLGAVAGVLATGFVLMPTVGLRSSFGILAACLGGIALLAAWLQGRHTLAIGSGSTLLVLALLFISSGEGWRHAISSGAFRSRETEPTPDAIPYRRAHVRILFYEDAPDATVSVEQGDGIEAPADIGLRINGKTDASSRIDLGTQTLLGHLPFAARPDSKDVFMLGLGGGITGGAVLKHPVERLVIAENCEPVVRAAKFFTPWNGGVLTDPRTHLWVEDARTILKLSPQRYDIVISQPSNPWMVGVGSVFSREYYELASTRLKEGGVMAQWFHLYDMHDGIVESVFRTFASVYPYMEVWDSGVGDVLLLGAKRPWNSTVERYQTMFEREPVRADLAKIGIHSAQSLIARQFASQRTAFAITGDGPIQSDLFPILEYEAPKAFYMGISASSLNQFDERTWQQEIASGDKRAALSRLNSAQLRQIFTTYSTINTNLQSYLVWRLRNDGLPSATFEPQDLRLLPCAFRSPNAPLPQAELPATAPDEVKKLIAAAAALEVAAAPEQRLAAVDQIQTLLRERTKNSDWSSSHYAALAARVSLVLGQPDRSRQLVELGLKFTPDDQQLHYLARILDREQPGAPKLSANDYAPQ
jgi:spermidine synthase